MAKEATIQKILKVEPIENADRLEKATILGWQIVVEKGQFQPGDLVCFIEIDSILPEKPEFEFMRKDKFRIRTRRFRGTLSQGLIFPLNVLESITGGRIINDKLVIENYSETNDPSK